VQWADQGEVLLYSQRPTARSSTDCAYVLLLLLLLILLFRHEDRRCPKDITHTVQYTYIFMVWKGNIVRVCAGQKSARLPPARLCGPLIAFNPFEYYIYTPNAVVPASLCSISVRTAVYGPDPDLHPPHRRVLITWCDCSRNRCRRRKGMRLTRAPDRTWPDNRWTHSVIILYLIIVAEVGFRDIVCIFIIFFFFFLHRRRYN